LILHGDIVFGYCYAATANFRNAHISLGGIAGMVDFQSHIIQEWAEEKGVQSLLTPVYPMVFDSNKKQNRPAPEGLYPLAQANSILHMMKGAGNILNAQYFVTFMFPGLDLIEEEEGFTLVYKNENK
jgi:hypothetical protein